MKSDIEIADELRARGEKIAETGTAHREPEPEPRPQDVGLAPTSDDTTLGPTKAGLMQGGQDKQAHPNDKK